MGLFDFIKALFNVSPGDYEHYSDDNLDDDGNTVFCFDLEKPRPDEISKCGINGPVKLWSPEKSDEKFYNVYRISDTDQGGQMGMVPEEFLDQIYDHSGYPYDAKVIYIGPSAKWCTIECTLHKKAITRTRWQEENKKIANKIKSVLSKPYRPKKDIKITVEPYEGKTKLFKHGLKLYLKERTLEEYLENLDPLIIAFCNDEGEEIAEKWRVPNHVKSIIRAQLSGHDIDFEVIEKAQGHPGAYYVQVTYHLK